MALNDGHGKKNKSVATSTCHSSQAWRLLAFPTEIYKEHQEMCGRVFLLKTHMVDQNAVVVDQETGRAQLIPDLF